MTTTDPHGCAFDPALHHYFIDGQRVPSVTQVLNEERFIDFSGVPLDVLSAAQQRGVYVHTVLHYLLEQDYDLDDCATEFRGYVDSALEYIARLNKRPLLDAHGKPMAVEFRFWHRARRFGGTVDWLGVDADGVLSIDDWKTGMPSDVAAPLQTAAYAAGVRDVLLPAYFPEHVRKPIRRRAVKLFKDGRPGRPEEYTDPRDLALFYAALSCTHYRFNGMRHTA